MKRMFSLMLCFAMALSLFTMPANACTTDGPDSEVIPCDKVAENGYCDEKVVWYQSGENNGRKVFSSKENPYYAESATTPAPQPTVKPSTNSQNDKPLGDTIGNIGGVPSYVDDDDLTPSDELFHDFINSLNREYADIIDYENLTIEYVGKDGKPIGYKSVMNPKDNMMTHYGPDGKELTDFSNLDWNRENPFEPSETAKPEVKHFDDVPADVWYAEAVNALAANGVLKGYDDGLFHPENNVTLGELSVIIYRLATGEDPVGKKGIPSGIPFTFAAPYGKSNHWAAYALETLESRQISYIVKMTDHIDEPATRGDAINAVYRLAETTIGTSNMTVVPEWKYVPTDWNRDMGSGFRYTDAELQKKSGIPDLQLDPNIDPSPSINYSRGMTLVHGIMLAYQYGIVHGIDAAGNCNPLGDLTRAELCQMLYNAGITQFTKKADWKTGHENMGHMGLVDG